MESENTSDSERRAMLSNRTLLIIAGSTALFIFILTGFSWEALFGCVFVSIASIFIYKGTYRAEYEAENEAIEVVRRHKNPEMYSRHNTNNVEVLDDIDLELMVLLESAFDVGEIEKLERSNSPYDPPFTFTWKNLFHYLIKGKQL